MAGRRRIDWTNIVGPDAASPVWRLVRARSQLATLVHELGGLFSVRHPDDMLRRAVELALGPVGLVRAGIYLYDQRLDLMLGTWGTSLRRAVVDEHHAMFRLGEQGGRVLARAMSGKALWAVVENCPIIDIRRDATHVVGRGWVVCTPICSPRRGLGMLYNDAGLTGARIDPRKQAHAAVLCALVALLLEGMPRARGKALASPERAPHPAVTEATRMLADDPSLSGADLAAHLRVSPSRFSSVFKAEMGVSLVTYRNQLRVDRFLALMERGGRGLADAARAAGFGSYAQFHRVFHSLRRTTPRAYLGRHIRRALAQ